MILGASVHTIIVRSMHPRRAYLKVNVSPRRRLPQRCGGLRYSRSRISKEAYVDPTRILEPMNVVRGADNLTQSVLGYRVGDLGLISIHPHDMFWSIVHLPSGLSIAAHFGIFMDRDKGIEALEMLSKMTNTWNVHEERIKTLLREAGPRLQRMGGIKMIPANVTNKLPEGIVNQPKDDI